MNYWERNTLTYVGDFRLFGDRKILKDFFGAWDGVWPPFLCQTFGESTLC